MYPLLSRDETTSIAFGEHDMGMTTREGPPVPLQREEPSLARNEFLRFARDIGEIHRRQQAQSAILSLPVDTLKLAYLSIIQTLALTVEAKDEYTRFHLDRCRDYGRALTRAVDQRLDTTELQFGFLLHDVGKIGIPEAILSKPGPLNASEYGVMKTHTLIGAQIVKPMQHILGELSLAVIRNHHERFDGQGYPDGLRGEQIPLVARIFSVVDAFDAITTDRPYRRSVDFAAAIEILREAAGTQFDPAIVEIFSDLVGDLSLAP